MICKEGAIDVISIGGNVVMGGAQQQQLNGGNSNGMASNGHNTLQHRRKSQLITFSSSSCDIKNSLSHEIILVNSSGKTGNGGSGGARGSIVGSISNGSNGTGGAGNVRLSFAEEDIMIVANGVGGGSNGSNSGRSASGSGSGSGNDGDLDDDVFRRRSLEVDEEELFDDEYGTHIEVLNNANDDSGGGSYEDSHAMHSSIGGSNRNSLEKDDDDIDVDVISTDVSCYDQLLGSSCNTRNDDDDIATLVGDGENYTKLCKNSVKAAALNGVGSGGIGENGGIIYANPFMDDEGIAESGM